MSGLPLPDYIFDHVDRALAAIVTKLEKPNVCSLVRVAALEIEEFEDTAWAAIAERRLETAVGANLDQYGKLVGEPRNGLNDLDYRAFIGARIRSNLSNGTVGEMQVILGIIGRALTGVQYLPLYPAAMSFGYVTETPAQDPVAARIVAQMTEVAPAGVEVAYIVEATEGYFGFDGDPEALGFNEGIFSRTL